MKNNTNVLICGSGIIGLTIARELLRRGVQDITVIEKEADIGMHASGRNSGVLHAGIYYAPDSFKAKSCIHGNRLMKDYCRRNNLPLNETGKVIVASNENEKNTLLSLNERAIENGTASKIIDEKELHEIEPFAKTFEKALYSPETAVVDPKIILKCLYDECINSGKVEIHFNNRFIKKSANNTIITNRGKIEYRLFINASGAHSDKIAHSFNLADNYRLLPFKGTYNKVTSESDLRVNGNIYPVPPSGNPFLGVHFTKSITGEIFIGPTAIPAVGRENYSGLKGSSLETLKFLFMDIMMYFQNSGFRQVAHSEPRKYIKKYFLKDASRLVSYLSSGDVTSSDKAGIRPQLVDWNRKELVNDFFVIRDENSIHILNSISPAFTSSLYFAELILDRYLLDTDLY